MGNPSVRRPHNCNNSCRRTFSNFLYRFKVSLGIYKGLIYIIYSIYIECIFSRLRKNRKKNVLRATVDNIDLCFCALYRTLTQMVVKVCCYFFLQTLLESFVVLKTNDISSLINVISVNLYYIHFLICSKFNC